MFQWLCENASDFGFHRPFISRESRGGKGYEQEKWHWSCEPLANQMRKDWEALIAQDLTKLGGLGVVKKSDILHQNMSPRFLNQASHAISWIPSQSDV
jgi:hypothetical protein